MARFRVRLKPWFRFKRAGPANVLNLAAAPHERPRDQKAAMALRGILLGAEKADAEARDAIEQPLPSMPRW